MKALTLQFLDRLCWLLDRIPKFEDGQWYRYGSWGCYPLRVSYLADWLEDRWKTGIWDCSPIPLDD